MEIKCQKGETCNKNDGEGEACELAGTATNKFRQDGELGEKNYLSRAQGIKETEGSGKKARGTKLGTGERRSSKRVQENIKIQVYQTCCEITREKKSSQTAQGGMSWMLK